MFNNHSLLQDEGVAMEACEFWWEFLKNSESAEFLLTQHDAAGGGSVLAALIPALISRFPLSAEQVGADSAHRSDLLCSAQPTGSMHCVVSRVDGCVVCVQMSIPCGGVW